MPIHLIFAIAMLAQQGSIKGVVLNSVTGTPVVRATVTLNGGQISVSAESNAAGGFEFTGVEAGTYWLSAWRPGFHAVADRHGGESRVAVKLAAGENASAVKLPLAPQGIITGRVTDLTGEPFQGAMVNVIRVASKRRQAMMGAAGFASTNDLGEFRIVDLRPGKYYVLVNANQGGGLSQVSFSSNAVEQAYAPVYFPGVTDSANAVPVEVSPGVVKQGIDVRISKAVAHSVRGTVVKENGQPAQGIGVTLQRLGHAGGFDTQGSGTDQEGRFQFHQLLPGSYLLTSQGENGFLETQIEVGDQNVEDLRLGMRPFFEMKITYRWDGGGGPPAGAGRPTVNLQPAATGGQFGGGFAQQLPDSSSIPHLTPGRKRVNVFGIGSQDYVKAIRYGGQAVEDGTIDFVPGADLEIVLRRGTGSVRGLVDGGGSDATVVLAPASAARQGDESLYRVTRSDDRGKFEFGAIAPGEYFVFAFEAIEPEAWFEPEFLTKYGGKGERVTLEEEAREAMKLTLIRASDR